MLLDAHVRVEGTLQKFRVRMEHVPRRGDEMVMGVDEERVFEVEKVQYVYTQNGSWQDETEVWIVAREVENGL